MKIRGTAQHVAEKYLQLARDAQSSGDIVLAENLLQHAEHYFRLIAAAQQQQNGGYGRTSYEQEAELEDDDDFTGIPDRFAPLSERLPSPTYAAQQPNFQPPSNFIAPSAPQPSFQAPQPQPFEERPAYTEMRHERPVRSDRVQFGGRNRDRDRGQEQNAEGGERPERGERQPRFGFDRNRERPRFEQRRDRDRRPRREPSLGAEQSGALESGAGLPAFITAPPTAPRNGPGDAPEAEAGQEHASGRGGFAMTARRRSRAAGGSGRRGNGPRDRRRAARRMSGTRAQARPMSPIFTSPPSRTFA